MKTEIDIGILIQKKMDEDGRKFNWLAKKINCDKSNITRICQRKYIDTEQLVSICICLEVDFFAYYSEYVIEEIKKKKGKE